MKGEGSGRLYLQVVIVLFEYKRHRSRVRLRICPWWRRAGVPGRSHCVIITSEPELVWATRARARQPLSCWDGFKPANNSESWECGGTRADQESQVPPSVEFNFPALLCKLNIKAFSWQCNGQAVRLSFFYHIDPTIWMCCLCESQNWRLLISNIVS